MIGRLLSRKFFAPTAGIAVALAVGLVGEYGYDLQRGRMLRDAQVSVANAVSHYRAEIEADLNATLYLTNGLVAYIETHTSPDPELANSMLKILYQQGKHIRNIGLAPGNRLTYVYPLKSNEKAIGLYYPDLPDQWPAVKLAIDEKRPRLAGPLELKQGGKGIIYRVPVFIGPDRKYWGILSMVIDEGKLFASAGIAPVTRNLDIALRGKDGKGIEGAVFLGNADLFSTDSVRETIRIPGGTWQIAAKPVSGWPSGRSVNWIRIGGWMLGSLLGFFLHVAILSVRRRLLAEEAVRVSHAELNEAQRVAMIGSWTFDIGTGKLSWSDEIYRIFEADPENFGASYQTFLDAVHPDDREKVDLAYRESVRNHSPYEFVHRLAFPDGRMKYVQERGETSYDEQGNPLISRGTVQDITRIKITEEELVRLATTDALTGAPNRRSFLKALENELSRVQRIGRTASLLLADLDYFKGINDIYGHATGDAVLVHFAGFATEQLRRPDFFGRIGGEEFAILLPETGIDGAWRFAEQFRELLSRTPAATPKGGIDYTVSIGLAELHPEDESIDEVMARADEELYTAKQRGRNRVEPAP